MQGKTHSQNCGVAVFQGGVKVFSQVFSAHLTMHQLSEQEIADYVALDMPLEAAGSYHFESHARLLFRKIEGSCDVIKGCRLWRFAVCCASSTL